MHRLVGMGTSQEVIIHNPSLANSMRALLERVFNIEVKGVFQPPPLPRPGYFSSELKHTLVKLHKLSYLVQPMTKEEFVASYTGPKRALYERVRQELEIKPLTKFDSSITAFVKAEKILTTPSKLDPAPRIIQPRSPRFNIEIGVYIKRIEKVIYRTIDKLFGETTVLKSYNAFERGKILREKFDRFRNPVVVSLDISRMDAHVHQDSLKYCHKVYLNYFPTGLKRVLRKLLNQQLVNRGRVYCADGKIKYKVNGRKMSGDMDTALGNVVIMCSLLYTWLEKFGIKFSVGDDGDDAFIIVEACDVPLVTTGIQSWFKDMGFSLKVDGVTSTFEHVVFCKSRPIFDGTEWRMVRECPSSIQKDTSTVLPLTNIGGVKNYYHDIGNCGLALTSGIPVLQEFYLAMVRAGEGARGFNDRSLQTSGMFRMAEGLLPVYKAVTDAARVSFYTAFGMLPHEQMALEDHYRSLDLPVKHDGFQGTRAYARAIIH